MPFFQYRKDGLDGTVDDILFRLRNSPVTVLSVPNTAHGFWPDRDRSKNDVTEKRWITELHFDWCVEFHPNQKKIETRRKNDVDLPSSVWVRGR